MMVAGNLSSFAQQLVELSMLFTSEGFDLLLRAPENSSDEACQSQKCRDKFSVVEHIKPALAVYAAPVFVVEYIVTISRRRQEDSDFRHVVSPRYDVATMSAVLSGGTRHCTSFFKVHRRLSQ